MSVRIYIVNFKKLVTQRLPVDLRQQKVMAFFLAFVSPIVTIYNALILFRTNMLYKLLINSQVVYLEKLLNDRYDTTLRRIHILDGKEYAASFLFTKAESKPMVIYRKSEDRPKFLYTRGEAGQYTFDFVVFVPVSVTYDTNEMTSLVASNKLASKLFTIQTF